MTEELPEVDLSKSRMPPFRHQAIGVQHLVEKPFFFLADEMGAGKTKQTIDAAQVLFHKNLIDRVLVITPASVRSVWYEPELGQLKLHLWSDTPSIVEEFHIKYRRWYNGPKASRVLIWTITNYDYVRDKDRQGLLLEKVCSPRTLLVLDESSAIKNYRAKQTKSCMKLRKKCGRIILLNGTPISHSPEDMYSQGEIMSPEILQCPTFTWFRSRYAVMGGWQGKQIVKWINLADLQRRFAPYVLRRLKSECLDLPPKLEPVTITATLSPTTWSIYKEMRDELVAWLNDHDVSVAAQAIVKSLRLAQITSGFLGGIEGGETISSRVIDSEKLDAFLNWFAEQYFIDPEIKLLLWCRFRLDLQRIHSELQNRYPRLALGRILGDQNKHEREEALRLLDPRTMPSGPVVVIGTPQSGSMGLNLAGAHIVVYFSNDYSLKTRLQSEDRVHRPGQVYPVSYFDIVATGPQGQKTIDHQIIKALRKKEEMAEWTTSAWIQALSEE